MAPSQNTRAPVGRTLGAVTYDGSINGGMWGYGQLVDTGEYVPELLLPFDRCRAYERMVRKTHIAALSRATFLALSQFDWHLDQGQASDETTARVAANLCLAIGRDGEEPDQRGGIPWGQHLIEAFEAPKTYGHAFFEIAASRKADGPFAGSWWLDKLESRPQNTIWHVHVNADGSLINVEQRGFSDPRIVQIPAERLVTYVFGQKPGDWYGEPLLRACWESEVYRDSAARIDGQALEFGGIGVPYARWTGEGDPTDEQYNSAMQAVAGYRGGGFMVDQKGGYEISVLTPGQSGVDPMASMTHWEQQASMAYMAGLLELGTSQNGSRALGDTFSQMWFLGLKSIAGFIAQQATNQIVRRIVDWNEGPDAPAPVVAFYSGDGHEATMQELSLGVQGRVLAPTRGVLDAVHRRLGFPPPTDEEYAAFMATPDVVSKSSQQAAQPADAATSVPVATSVQAAASAVPSDGLRREPTMIEAASRIDFKRADTMWKDAKERLVQALQGPRAAAAARLVAAVEKAGGNLDKLGKISVDSVGEKQFIDAAQAIAREGALTATAEAHAQGVADVSPVLEPALAQAAVRGQASALALAQNLATSAIGKALSLTAQKMEPAAVADQVAGHLNALTDADLSRRAGATLSGAMGDGRSAALASAAETFAGATHFYSSAMLDSNCCSSCSANDGAEYATLADAEDDYPGGAQYVGCEGGDQCRCLTIAVFEEDQ